jgi:2-heptyl-1-hydroxyquinolin-4(1H)-one methyltransferase
MTGDPQPPEMDFEEVYRDGGRTSVIPWDIGEPQPPLAELVSMGWCRGSVLDAGCGTGELGLALAARGHDVTGIDVASGAIDLAKRKATERSLDATFHQGDATELAGYDADFDTVLDSGLLHCLEPDAQVRYVEALRRVCRPGGRVAVLCFADRPEARTPPGRRLTESRLRELFGDGWDIEELTPADILGTIPEGLGEMSEWPRDDRGKTLMSGWRMRAERAGSA